VSYTSAGAVCEVALGEAWRVRPDTQLIADLGAWLAPENVEVVYTSA
jgi:DNA polymerase-3 subunit alpha